MRTENRPDVYRRTTCRLCGSSRLQLVMNMEPSPVADSFVSADEVNEPQGIYPMDLYFCLDCNLVQLLYVVDPEIIYRKYLYVTLTSLGLDAHYDRYAASVIERVKPPKDGMVVEFGSNDGTLLRAFQRRGHRVLGIDPAIEIAKTATAAGVETWPTFFTADVARRIRSERSPASIIVANNVIANIDILDDVMDGIRGLLSPSGVFIFETGYLLDLVKYRVFDNIYHEHLSYYAVKPLESFFRRQGLELVHMERVETKGGSIRGTVQLAGGPRPVDSSVAEFISRERDLGLDKPETYQTLAAEINSVKTDLNALMDDLKSKGKTFAGYGASPSVTTVIYHFDLSRRLDFLVDDNPRKQGRFSPGHHIPVLPSDVLYKRNPDYVVILPWRYVDPIVQKHQAFLKQGGHFIVPLPKVTVI